MMKPRPRTLPRAGRITLVSRSILPTLCIAMLGGCATFGGSGPSTQAVKRSEGQAYADADIQVIDLTDAAITRARQFTQSQRFGEIFGQGTPVGTIIGVGDVLDIAVWEAPPAALFGATRVDAALSIAQGASIPQQMVGEEGSISVPFVGNVQVRGQTPAQVERMIETRLAGRAHDPQVVVRLVQNEARTVTVLGEVGVSKRVPLTARGERLLDMIASTGGVRQPVGKTTVQLARGTLTARMSLEAIIHDPAQNIIVRPDDVVTVMFQPYSFIALGAVGKSAEVPFEGGGLSLTQALGRVGGLRDEQANVRGVFIFRLEHPAALDPDLVRNARRMKDGRIPVIYRLNMADASSLFLAQDFMVQDRDVIYVSNAPAVDLQKFINTVSSAAFSLVTIGGSL